MVACGCAHRQQSRAGTRQRARVAGTGAHKACGCNLHCDRRCVVLPPGDAARSFARHLRQPRASDERTARCLPSDRRTRFSRLGNARRNAIVRTARCRGQRNRSAFAAARRHRLAAGAPGGWHLASGPLPTRGHQREVHRPASRRAGRTRRERRRRDPACRSHAAGILCAGDRPEGHRKRCRGGCRSRHDLIAVRLLADGSRSVPVARSSPCLSTDSTSRENGRPRDSMLCQRTRNQRRRRTTCGKLAGRELPGRGVLAPTDAITSSQGQQAAGESA